MYAKLFVIAAIVLVAVAQDRYPAGLNPALCPNYPNCDNSIIATFGPQASPIPLARSYPADVPAAACPNYPYCNVNLVPAGYVAREYPAGVPAAACPNYPYC
ncbi:cuticle protein 1 [Anabrus simplex]|uniref:cuticle protein 1 n=1 Tax=Anabrus simplex TaxID=316456 RepID=UPI0034DD519D